MSGEQPVWGTGQGSRRHLVVVDSIRRNDGWGGSDRIAVAACSPGSGPASNPWLFGQRLDYFDDRDDKPAYFGATRTQRQLVLSRKPCMRCAKRAAELGIEP